MADDHCTLKSDFLLQGLHISDISQLDSSKHLNDEDKTIYSNNELATRGFNLYQMKWEEYMKEIWAQKSKIFLTIMTEPPTVQLHYFLKLPRSTGRLVSL